MLPGVASLAEAGRELSTAWHPTEDGNSSFVFPEDANGWATGAMSANDFFKGQLPKKDGAWRAAPKKSDDAEPDLLSASALAQLREKEFVLPTAH